MSRPRTQNVRSEHIMVKLTPTEKRKVVEYAKAVDRTVSSCVRLMVLEALEKEAA